MFFVALLTILVTLSIAIFRAITGPSQYDRILAVNSIGTKTVLIIAIYGYFTDRPDFADLALLYAMLNFLGTVAILRFLERQYPSQRYLDKMEENQ